MTIKLKADESNAVRKTSEWQFNKRFLILVVALVLILAGLFVVSAMSGPRLRHVMVDPALVASQTNQRLVMQANQPLKKIASSNITITPSIPFTVSNNASNVVITFTQRLKYDTTYAITVNDVVAQYGNVLSKNHATTFHYSFSTYNPTLFYLKRSGAVDRKSAEQDQILQTVIGGDPKVVYAAPRIQSFVLLDKKMVVSTTNAKEADTTGSVSSLHMVDLQSHQVADIALPAAGQVDRLHSSADGKTYGFRFTSNSGPGQTRKYENILFVHDTSPGRLMVPLSGLNGNPLQVMDWKFAPDGTTVVAQTYDNNVLLVDTNFKNAPVPLGRFQEMSNFSPSGTQMIMRERTGYTVLDLLGRTRAPAQPEPVKVNGLESLPMHMQFLSNREGLVSQLQVSYDQGRRFDDFIVLTDKQGQRNIYQIDTAKYNLSAYTTSPNGQYTIVEQSVGAGLYDNYPDTSMPLQTQSLLIDNGTSKKTATVNGFDITWQ